MGMKNYGRHGAATAATSTEPLSPTIVIAGAGIVGLVLALALKKHAGITAELYEQARSFQDGVGAGIGLYPNGMRVLRDISPEILERIQQSGYPYLFRRWEVNIQSVRFPLAFL
jgi:2-polyprenyl-6-methoxyphenol hydroxylase-like FAD-dependent oxidoreductase